MKKLTEEETDDRDGTSSESEESIHHIKEIKKIEEKNKYYTATVKKKEFIIDRTLVYSTPAWLDDITVVTRENKPEHEKKLFDILNKLGKAEYPASKRKSEFFMNRTKWLGNEIDDNGIKPNEEKVEAILKLNPPENTKELDSFLGAIQYMAKFLTKLSERTNSGNY